MMQSDYSVDSVTIMSLNQMCDLALGFVNPGVIHFDLLHQILRAIIQQCQLIDVKIKVQGDKSVEMQKFTPHKTSQVTLPSVKGSSYSQLPPISSIPIRDSSIAPTSPFPKKSHADATSSQKDNDWMTPIRTENNKDANVIVLDPSTNKPLEHTVSITVDQMQWIIDSIENLQQQINEMKTFPNNHDILGALRESGQTGSTSQKPSESGTIPQGAAPVRNISNTQTPLVDMFQILSLTKRVDAAEESVTKLASLVQDLARDVGGGSKEQLLDIESLSELQGVSIAALGNKNALELLEKEVKALKLLIYGEGEDLGTAAANLQTKVSTVEVRLKQILDQVEVLDRLTSEQINNLFGQCGGLEDTLFRLERKLVESIQNQKAPLISLNDRYKTMEQEIEKVKDEQKRVFDANAHREMEISALMEQLEVMKTIKVNKEEFEDALDRKLDTDKILSKVSQEKFDRTYDELKINIDEAIAKLSTQEEMWQKALVELQNELVTKLEKNELIALQDFVKTKLKVLRDKVKSMRIYQTEQEAAVTKQSLMKNVKCLSCDADVSTKMKMSPRDYPRSPTLPPTRTIAPYLAYELDVMRKQQRGLSNSKNLHHFEASIRNKTDKLENRYCGGPHTVTTPVQRVTRLGHFLEQWGPELASANENFIKGTDQKVYVGCMAQPVKSERHQSVMTVAGDILRERKSQHGDLTSIPEKDSVASKGESERRNVSGNKIQDGPVKTQRFLEKFRGNKP